MNDRSTTSTATAYKYIAIKYTHAFIVQLRCKRANAKNKEIWYRRCMHWLHFDKYLINADGLRNSRITRELGFIILTHTHTHSYILLISCGQVPLSNSMHFKFLRISMPHWMCELDEIALHFVHRYKKKFKKKNTFAWFENWPQTDPVHTQ